MTKIKTRTGENTSLQITHLQDASGDFSLDGVEFLIKNNTGAKIELQVKCAKDDEYVTTTIYPGWNPEIVSAIKGAPSTGIQIGY